MGGQPEAPGRQGVLASCRQEERPRQRRPGAGPRGQGCCGQARPMVPTGHLVNLHRQSREEAEPGARSIFIHITEVGNGMVSLKPKPLGSKA